MNNEAIKKIMRKTYNHWLMEGYTNKFAYLLQIRKNFNTASWNTEFKNGKTVNVITIGEQALDMANDYGSKERLVVNFLYHEFGHSRFTSNNLASIVESLKKIYADFQLFNIFEDCRMENLTVEMTNHRFNWFNYVEPKFMGLSMTEPESLLLASKNGEIARSQDNYEIVKDAYLKAFHEKRVEEGDERTEIEIEVEAEELAERVMGYYYPKILKAKTSTALLPIIKEWLDEFYDSNELKRKQEQEERFKEMMEELIKRMLEAGIESAGQPNGDEDGSGSEEDGESELEGKSGNSCLKSFDDLESESGIIKKPKADTSDIVEVIGELTKIESGESGESGNGKKEENKFGAGNKKFHEEHDTYTIKEFSTNFNMLREDYKDDTLYNRPLAQKLTMAFERVLVNPTRKVSTSRPSKRLSMRGLMMGSENIYKRKEEIVKSAKDISLVVDCSGSMWHAMREMRIVIAIINNLSMKGKVKGHIILSSTSGCQTLKMPIVDKDIDKIIGYWGGEGLEMTFKHTMPLLKKSEKVFVLTDGDLTDGSIDRKFLAQNNVKPIGLYIGEEAKNLSKWFDVFINRANAKATVDEMIRKVGR